MRVITIKGGIIMEFIAGILAICIVTEIVSIYVDINKGRSVPASTTVSILEFFEKRAQKKGEQK